MSRSAHAKRQGPWKPGYEGRKPSTRVLSVVEAAAFADARERLVRRLHDAMLMLTVLSAHDVSGGGSGWPAYVHDFADKVSQAEIDQPGSIKHFDPTRAQIDDVLPALALLDGLRPAYQKVLFFRALHEWLGWGSWEEIGDRLGQSRMWARNAYEAVIIQAARRAGMIAPAPHGWAVLVAGVHYAGWRTFITTASDPVQQLRDLKAKSPIRLDEAFALWTPGQLAAKAITKAVRLALQGRATHASWHAVNPDELSELIIAEAQAAGVEWQMEVLPCGGRVSGPRSTLLKASLRSSIDSPDEALNEPEEG